MRLLMLVLPLLLSVLLGALTAVEAHADLDSFFKKPEPAYAWKKIGQKTVAGGTVYDLHLVSQTWQGREWEHRAPDLLPGQCWQSPFLHTAQHRRQRQ